jgi:hypothetical protein
LFVERLAQETNRSSFQQSRPNTLLEDGRDEYYWHVLILGDQGALQFDPTHARHLNIRDQTRRIAHVRGLQEIFSGCE